MRIHRARNYLLLLPILLAAALPVPGQLPETLSPGAHWQTVAPESVGYSSEKLTALSTWLRTENTTAMIVAVHGKVIFQYGDVSHVSVVASVRKSILSMLYGNYAFSGKIDLQKTVKQIGLDDKQPFLPIEEKATLEQILAGRSDIFIVPDKADPSSADDYQPRRGSALPGTFFTYNEWDFNAAGAAFEKLTGRNIYDALDADLARPIGMEDFDRVRQVKVDNLPFSVHQGYPMYLSTRDMARLGQLMLRQGDWNGKQVISGDWVRYSTLLWTPFQEMYPTGLRNYAEPARWGFGLMWFVWDEPPYLNHSWAGPMQGAFLAQGYGGQYIAVFPQADMVIAHKVELDPYPQRSEITPMQWNAIVDMVLASSCEANCPANK